MNTKKWIALSFALVMVLVGVGVTAGQGERPAGLSDADRAEILQLYAAYAHAIDRRDADAYGSMFVADGEFVTPARRFSGRAEVSTIASRGGALRERPKVRHVTTNVVVNPSSEGATGSAYVVLMDLTQNPVITGGGIYEDVIVKTSEGWRFKRRSYFPEPSAPEAN